MRQRIEKEILEPLQEQAKEKELVEKRMQAADHPVLVNVPETYYLKCLVLRRLA